MKWNELAELICAFISLLVTAIIGKKQYYQSRRMEEFERRQDERDERRHAEGNRAQAVEFISRYYSDRGLIPLCAVAAMHNDLFYYSREMYRNFCCLVPEVQNLILDYCNLELRVRKENDLFNRCIAAAENALCDRFPKDESVFYDDGKYVLRSLDRYAGEKMPAVQIDCPLKCLDASCLPSDGYSSEYDRPIANILSRDFESQDSSATLIFDLEKTYCFKTSTEIEACRFATTLAFHVATFCSNDKVDDKDYGCPGGFEDERIETMEDLFLLAIFQMYTRLLLPDEE